MSGQEFKIARSVKVLKKGDEDLGFQTKIGFWAAESDQVEDYHYFSPGEWYKHNEYAPRPRAGQGHDGKLLLA